MTLAKLKRLIVAQMATKLMAYLFGTLSGISFFLIIGEMDSLLWQFVHIACCFVFTILFATLAILSHLIAQELDNRIKKGLIKK